MDLHGSGGGMLGSIYGGPEEISDGTDWFYCGALRPCGKKFLG